MRGRSIVAAVLLLVALATAPVVARDGWPLPRAGRRDRAQRRDRLFGVERRLEYDIYTVVPGDETPTPIRLTTDGRYNADPDWSPDGTQIVYDGWADQPGPRIQVMDIDPSTDDWTVLSEPCPEDPIECYGDFQPAWSPDGTRIAFVSSRPTINNPEGWSYEIFVMDAVGEVGPQVDATALTSDAPDPETGGGIEDSMVTWSPDGTRLAFVSTGRGDDVDSCDLWVMDSRDRDGDGFGDDLQRLTFDESFNCDAFEDVTPQWSPTSNLIAFTSVRTGYFDIWLVNANDPTDLRNVTGTPERYEDQPGWSPDGTQVTFRRPVDGAYEFFSLPVPPAAAGSVAAAARPRATQPDVRRQAEAAGGLGRRARLGAGNGHALGHSGWTRSSRGQEDRLRARLREHLSTARAGDADGDARPGLPLQGLERSLLRQAADVRHPARPVEVGRRDVRSPPLRQPAVALGPLPCGRSFPYAP